eukprot:CAMPEP_0114588756 /NCGR_PEP_ID=MMETSP0125-20121206/11382_1 /TAXON_ID=485358 ORGANISM="Aristerostoma sp., Strain ATCC 50986" /NCGR_SAMPLE_ID=MMETSP0125 /ASSEMBLY_ACC=CAM_ASM_000245 /LENGTH=89 /DNA_ID=CAMNT_0001785317 /DNA_START=157 /DNA_END=426 /DNA_ORIENTATION=+
MAITMINTSNDDSSQSSEDIELDQLLRSLSQSSFQGNAYYIAFERNAHSDVKESVLSIVNRFKRKFEEKELNEDILKILSDDLVIGVVV